MALVNCRVCGSRVSEDADPCPVCGNKDIIGAKSKSRLLKKVFGVSVAIVALSYLWFVQIPELREKGIFPKTHQK